MRGFLLSVTALFLGLGFAIGCDATSDNNGFGGSGPGPGSSGAGGDGGSLFPGTGGSGSGGFGSGCSEAAKLIYVLSDANDLYSFRPDQKQFTKIGKLGCQTAMQPNSMAVDREAVAWVNYVQFDGLSGDTAGSLFKVSTFDASCQSTGMALPYNWYRVGMGFSSDAAGGDSETLYLTGTDNLGSGSPGLGRFDMGSTSLVPIGEFSGALNGENAELTGTGDGRLFGFFTTSPVQVGELNKGNGSIVGATPLPPVEDPTAWAFSFWGGDFYLYTAPDQGLYPNRTTNVTRYRPSDGSIDTTYMVNIGFRIVGAGVSTCAPLEPPK